MERRDSLHTRGHNMNPLTKNCIVCSKEFPKPFTCSKTRWENQYKTCSLICSNTNRIGKHTAKLGMKMPNFVPWNKGAKGLQKAWNKGKGDYAKKLGFGKWMTGKKQTKETRLKKSFIGKRRVAEGNHNFWKGGITPEVRRIRTSVEYKLWRDSVFIRDDYTCQWCGARCGNGKKVYLHADHIQLFSTHPELRFAIDNGRTLCKECHYKRHSKKYFGNYSNSFNLQSRANAVR